MEHLRVMLSNVQCHDLTGFHGTAPYDAAADTSAPFGGQRLAKTRHLFVHSFTGVRFAGNLQHDIANSQELAGGFRKRDTVDQ